MTSQTSRQSCMTHSHPACQERDLGLVVTEGTVTEREDLQRLRQYLSRCARAVTRPPPENNDLLGFRSTREASECHWIFAVWHRLLQ